MQFWVYILRCRDGSYYTGHTENLEKRLAEHEQGLGADWTRRRRPVELVSCEVAPTREEALAFERRVKPWSRPKKEALIAGDWARLNHYSRPPRERPSTALGTNEDGAQTSEFIHLTQNPFVPSEVEGHCTGQDEAH